MALAPTQNQKQGPSQEYLLLDYLQRLNRSLEGRMAVHIHLSRLRPQNRQDHHVRIAATTFEGMTQTYEVRSSFSAHPIFFSFVRMRR